MAAIGHTLQLLRTCTGERMMKMQRLASVCVGETRKDDTTTTLSHSPSSESYPPLKSIEKEKVQLNFGKYVIMKLEDAKKDINEAHPVMIGKILSQYFTGQ